MRFITCFFLLVFLFCRLHAQRMDVADTVTIGGIRQFIHIKTADSTRPLLLFLHGGPGGSLMKMQDRISGKLQEKFVVVHWDQRETGRTLALNGSPKPLTLEMFYQDTEEIVDTLLRRFNRAKLYLVGYSWGSGLGFHIAATHPEKLYAYIAVSAVVNQRKSDSLSLDLLKSTMGSKARRELASVKIPFENADQLYTHRKWLMKHAGQKLVSLTLPKSYVEAWARTWFEVWSKSNTLNLTESLPAIQCPVYFFAGQKDYNTSWEVARDYFQELAAPKKDFFLFPSAGHELPETHAGEFQEVIIEVVMQGTVGG